MNRPYWWLYGRYRESGDPFLVFGSDKSEEDARQKGLELLAGQDLEWDVKMIRTRNISAASRSLKGYKLEQTKDLRTATTRLKHKRINGRRLIL